MASLLYGSGLRSSECLRMGVKDSDFDYGQITVRDSKGNKDRVTMLPDKLKEPLRQDLENVKNCTSKTSGKDTARFHCLTRWPESILNKGRRGVLSPVDTL